MLDTAKFGLQARKSFVGLFVVKGHLSISGE